MEKVNASPEPALRVLVGATAWLTGVVAVILAGGFRGPVVGLSVAGTIAVLVVLYRRGGALRTCLDRLDVRWAIAVHIVRAPIGWALLWDMNRGNLPALFAERAGPGDIAAGLLAVPLLFVARHRVAVVAWNVFGLVDLLVAVVTAQYLYVIAGDPKLNAVESLPYAALPAILVPVMISLHLWMLFRRRP
jgi:hypothetical protein